MNIILRLQRIGHTKDSAASIYRIYKAENKLEVLERYLKSKESIQFAEFKKENV